MLKIQNEVKDIREEIRDLLKVCELNIQSLKLTATDNTQEKKESESALTEQFEKLRIEMEETARRFELRCDRHLDYLIVRQIEEEEESVRRDRLAEYEDRIYDQRRIISDKETFLENLLRPKRKRPEEISVEDFQKIRNKEKEDQEMAKFQQLKSEVQSIENLNHKADLMHYEMINHQNQQLSHAEEIYPRDILGSASNESIKDRLLEQFRQNFASTENQCLEGYQRFEEIDLLVQSIQKIKASNGKKIAHWKELSQENRYLNDELRKLRSQYAKSGKNQSV